MITAVVLAAGRSTRMARQKLLLPYGGRPMIAHIVAQAAASRAGRCIVVTGYDRDGVEEALAGTPAECVHNPDYDGGMLQSVRCGLRAVPADTEGVVVIPGDQPAVTPGIIDALIDAFHGDRSGIVVPVYQGRRGHPMLFSAGYREAVCTDFDGVGLRGLLRRYPESVVEVPLADVAVVQDVDTPEDYDRAVVEGRCQGADAGFPST